MKTTRLVLGIVTIVLFAIICVQSCAIGIVNSVNESSDVGGSAGFIVALLSLIAGIVGIVTRNGVGGGYVAAGFYIFAGIIGLGNSVVYSDLGIWGVLFIIFGIVFVLGARKTKKLQALNDVQDVSK